VRDAFGGIRQDDPPDPSPEAQGDPALRQRIASALDGLTRSQREVFTLVHLEGFTVRECAEVLGKPAGTVKSHLHRALTTLRRELSDLQDAPAPWEDS
jgi:RNA polymerase sigma-70 factor (ECF subfamily)